MTSGLSRRAFLRLIGVSVAGLGISGIIPAAGDAAALPPLIYGRAFTSTHLLAAPGSDRITGALWPDQIVPLRAAVPGWLAVPGGWLPAETIQPLPPASARPPEPLTLPFPALVSAASVPVRGWCAADAPLVTTIGCGGAAQVIDRLTIGRQIWYGISDDAAGTLLGWSPAAAWQPLVVPRGAVPVTALRIDRAAGTLSALNGEHVRLTAPAALRYDLPRGTHEVMHCTLCTSNAYTNDDPAEITGYHAVPFPLTFSGGEITGAYWHNRFTAVQRAAFAVTVTPFVARWLHERVRPGTPVIVA